ncbi:MAG: MucB/RseB C-terminal domain-containing protein [Burkholderiales bacterium]|nr:MucB/RseB C-terminal domain-containing protein [Burkholderiales bacterium]
MKLALGLCLAAVLAGPVRAQAADDALALLRRIYRATEKLSYTGTFVTQQGDRVESSRITRYAGPGGEIERIEVLDGTPREIVRTRDTIRCYLPERRTVKVERRLDPRAFPALLPETFADLLRNYAVSRGESARIAGYDCESVVLTPRDDLRYGYQLWADTASGMLLRARTFNARGETVEQFTFTQLAIGPVPRERLKPRHAARDWRIEYATVAPTRLEEQGWRLAEELPGFRKIAEVTRRIGEADAVNQVVYSDGMAALSVFIEPASRRAERIQPGLATLGAVNIYTRQLADHVVTVVGEVPAASVRRLGNTVEYRRPDR